MRKMGPLGPAPPLPLLKASLHSHQQQLSPCGRLPEACSIKSHLCTEGQTPSNASINTREAGAAQESPDTVFLLHCKDLHSLEKHPRGSPISQQHPAQQDSILQTEPQKSSPMCSPLPPHCSWLALCRALAGHTWRPTSRHSSAGWSKEQSQTPNCRLVRWVHARETKDRKSLKCTAGIHTPIMFL